MSTNTKTMSIKEINKETDKLVLQGWIHDIRDLGSIIFLQLRDSTGIIQLVIEKSKSEQTIVDISKKLTKESAIIVEGKSKAVPKSASKSEVKSETKYEIIPDKIKIISISESDIPISVTEKTITTGLSKRLDWRSIDLRKLKMQAIFRIQSALLEGAQEWLHKENFVQVFTPCILGVASEGGSEVFSLIYFDKEAFLRQDPQLHRQLTIAGGFTKIFDIGPAWRAEHSHTNRHLCEHRVIAVESAFIKNERDTMRIEEQLIISALKKVKETCTEELKSLGLEIKIPKDPFPELTFPEIYEVLRSRGKNISDGDDVDTESDKILWEYVQEKYGSDVQFYFLNRFPSRLKPFYVMKVDETPEYARSVDMYFRGMEMSSGGQREHRYDKIMSSVAQKKMSPESVEWFTKFFKYGVPTHGGFAIGIERLTMTLLNVENIRDCVLFPRDDERLVP